MHTPPPVLLILGMNDSHKGVNFIHLAWLMLLHYLVKVGTLKMHVNTNLDFNVNKRSK